MELDWLLALCVRTRPGLLHMVLVGLYMGTASRGENSAICQNQKPHPVLPINFFSRNLSYRLITKYAKWHMHRSVYYSNRLKTTPTPSDKGAVK